MTSRYRHRRTPLAATPFPSPIEPGEIVVNTAMRQIAVGDASAGTLGVPKPLIGVRFFDTTATYVLGDIVVQGGKIYKANGNIPAGSFNASNWSEIGSSSSAAAVGFAPGGNIMATNVQAAIAEVDAEKVAKAGDVMTGMLEIQGADLFVTGGDVTTDGDVIGTVGRFTQAFVNGPPTAPLELTTKAYVDTKVAAGTKVLVSDTPPAGAADGSLWWESDSGLLYFRYNDGNTTQWVIASPQPDFTQYALATDVALKADKTYVDAANATQDTTIGGKVAKAGDTMTGDLTISKTDPSIWLNRTGSNDYAYIYGRKNGVNRWALGLGDNAVESGGNTGSNLNIVSLTDAAGFLAIPLSIERSTSKITVAVDPTAALGVATKQYVDAAKGQVLLNTLTASNSASLSDITSFTSAYNEFILVFENVLPATDAVIGRLRVRNAGAFQATGYVGHVGGQGAASVTWVVDAPTTYIPVTNAATYTAKNTGPGLCGDLTMYGNPAGTAKAKTFKTDIVQIATAFIWWNGGGVWNSTAAIDGIEFTFSSGNIASGTIKIYGIK